MEGSYDTIARFYDLIDLPFEWLYYRRMRRRWIGTLRNEKILEVGVGTGKNLEYYHPSNRVYAVDRSRGMLSIARKRHSRQRSKHIKLSYQPGLPWSVPDDFTVAVATFVLCTMRDPSPVLEEIHGHLVPGGKLIIFEFARSQNPLLLKVEQSINPLTRALFGVDFRRQPTLDFLEGNWEVVEKKLILGDMIYTAVLQKRVMA